MTAPDEQNTPDPPVKRPTWHAVSLIAAAVLLVAGGITYVVWPDPQECATGIKKFSTADGERCAGLTDGAFAFSEDLRHVSELIEKENETVTEEAGKPGGKPYVSVVYLLDMTPGNGDSNTRTSIRHEIEGAYTAQLRANHHSVYGDVPQIRLLLGNIADGSSPRTYTIDQISSRRDSDRIVGAVGLGTSQKATKEMVERLAKRDIASFGAVLTADNLKGVTGLVRAAPPNADEAAAAVQFLKTKRYEKSSVLIVEDTNPDDLYTSTLATTFGDRLPPQRLAADEAMQYDSSKTSLATYFSNQMPNLCEEKPGVVYFAGRGRNLPAFLGPLARRNCNGTELTVLSGDDVSQAAQSPGFTDVIQALSTGSIRLVYTGLAHPDAWTKAPGYFDKNAIVPFQPGGTFFGEFPHNPRGNLADGQVIMAYDAMLTAVKAIRSTVPKNSDRPVRSSDVMQMLHLLKGEHAVPGASGWMSYSNDGSTENKAIPILEIGKGGEITTIDVTARSGTPYAPPGQAANRR